MAHHTIDLVDYSDLCTCADCKHIRDMTPIDHASGLMERPYKDGRFEQREAYLERLSQDISPEENNEVIDYDDDFADLPF